MSTCFTMEMGAVMSHSSPLEGTVEYIRQIRSQEVAIAYKSYDLISRYYMG